MNKIATGALIVAMGVIVACGGGGPVAVASPEGAPETLHFILRPDASGAWYIQNDGDHRSVGVHSKVEQSGDYLRVHFLRGYKHAVTVQVTSDDDFGGRVQGYSNLGLGSATIRVEAGGKRIDPTKVWDHVPQGGGNFWVTVVMQP